MTLNTVDRLTHANRAASTASTAKCVTKRAMANAARSKVTYDLDAELAQRVTDVAHALGCSQSDVIAHFIAAGLALYASGRLDLKRLRVPHTCTLRFTYKLPSPHLPPLHHLSEEDA